MPEDLSTVSKFFLDKGCRVIKRQSKTPQLLIEYDITENHEDIFQVYLYNSEYTSCIFYEHLESKDIYYLDILRSFCIEFSIGGFYPYSNKELHSSRLYYVVRYWENGIMVQKDKKFIEWADDIIKGFKKEFLKKDLVYSKGYTSKKFIEWADMTHPQSVSGGNKFVID